MPKQINLVVFQILFSFFILNSSELKLQEAREQLLYAQWGVAVVMEEIEYLTAARESSQQDNVLEVRFSQAEQDLKNAELAVQNRFKALERLEASKK